RTDFHLLRLLLIETVLAEKILGDVDSQTRGVDWIDGLLVSAQTTCDDFAEDHLIRLEELQYQKIRYGETGVDRGDGADGAVRVVRRNRNVISVGHRGDLLEFRDAPRSGDVRLNDAHRLAFQKLAEPMPAADALARGQRDVNRALHFGHRRDVLRRNGFFIKEQAVRLERANYLDRGLRVPTRMDIDGDVVVRPSGFAHGLDLRHRAPQFRLCDFAVQRRGGERIELTARETLCHRFFRARGERLGSSGNSFDPSVGVDPEFFLRLSAEEFVNGNSQLLSDNVVERRVNPADGGQHHSAHPVVIQEPVHPVPEFLDVPGAFAHNRPAQIPNGSRDGLNAGEIRPFAPTDNALFGLYSNEQPRAIASDSRQ